MNETGSGRRKGEEKSKTKFDECDRRRCSLSIVNRVINSLWPGSLVRISFGEIGKRKRARHRVAGAETERAFQHRNQFTKSTNISTYLLSFASSVRLQFFIRNYDKVLFIIVKSI